MDRLAAQLEWPPELHVALDGERPEYVARAARAAPLKQSVTGILVGLGLVLFTALFLWALLGDIVQGGATSVTINDRPTVVTWDNIGVLAVPIIVIGLFLLIGLVVLVYHARLLARAGPWVAATPQRLLLVDRKGARSIPWGDFTGDIRRETADQNGTLHLEQRQGRMVGGRKGRSERWVPHIVHLVGIPDVTECERIVRRAIQAAHSAQA